MYFNHKKNVTPIFFVIHGLPMGGAEKFLISLINQVQKEWGNAILILLGGKDTLENEVAKNIEIIKLNKRHKFDASMILALNKLLKSKKPSKVFCINAYSFFLAKLAAPRKSKISFYLSPHTTIAFSLKYDLLSRIFYSLFKKNDTAIFLCRYQMKYLKNRYLANRGHAEIIYNGVDTHFFDPKNVSNKKVMQIRKSIGISHDEFIILSVARISKEKGHDDAIDALSLLHKMYRIKAHLLFVGDGNESIVQKLKIKIEENELDPFVHFAGAKKDVRPYYKACNLFTLASTSETFSLSALEAMSFGKPCVLTDVGGAKEMIQANKNGLLAKPMEPYSIASAWNHLLSRPQLNPYQIRKQIEMNFDINRMLGNYLTLLKNHIELKENNNI